jgi:hypothetical protein
MDLWTEVEFRPKDFPELCVVLRRISMARRLRFLAVNHELMRVVHFPRGAQGPYSAAQRAEAEIELSRRILNETLIRVEGVETPTRGWAEWLVQDAPQKLCLEVLERAGEAMILGEEQRKKS